MQIECVANSHLSKMPAAVLSMKNVSSVKNFLCMKDVLAMKKRDINQKH